MANLLIDRLAVGLGYDTRGLRAGETQLGASMGRMLRLIKSPQAAIAAVGVAAASAATKATQEAAKWQTSWAEVRTIMSGTEAEIGRVEKRVLALGSIVPQEGSLLAKGYYQTLSAGISDVNDALYVTQVAAKAATAGLTDTFTSVDVITTVLNAYGMQAADAQHVSDLLFTTVREGKTTFGELAGSVGQAIPFFAQANIKIEDLLSAIATLTKGGIRTDVAATALRGMVTAVIKPAEEAVSAAEDLGIAFNTQAIAAKGLVPWMQELAEKTGGSTDAIAKLFPEVRGMAAVLNLAGKQAGEFSRIQDVLANRSAGNAERAFQEMNNTLSAQAKILQNNVQEQWIKLGKVFVGPVTGALKAVNSLFSDGGDQQVEALKKTKAEVDRLESTIMPLADRYDELRAKTKLNSEESDELRRILDQLSDAYPDLVVEVDKFGKAISFNTGFLRTYRSALLEAFDEDLIKAIRDKFDLAGQLRRQREQAINEIKRINRELQREAITAIPGSGIPGRPGSERRVNIPGVPGDEAPFSMKLDVARRRRDFLVSWLGETNAQLGAIDQQMRQLAANTGLESLLVQWSELIDRQRDGEDVSVALAKVTEDLRDLIGRKEFGAYANQWLVVARNIREAAEAARRAKEETLKFVVASGPLAGVPTDAEPGGGVSPLTFVAERKLSESAKAELESFRAFVESWTKRTFDTGEFQSFVQESGETFQQLWDLYEEDKRENEKRLKEKLEAEREYLGEILKISAAVLRGDLVRSGNRAVSPTVTSGPFAGVGGIGYQAGGIPAPGKPVLDPLATSATGAEVKVDLLTDGILQLADAAGLGASMLPSLVSGIINIIGSSRKRSAANTIEDQAERAAAKSAANLAMASTALALFGGAVEAVAMRGMSAAERMADLERALDRIDRSLQGMTQGNLSKQRRQIQELQAIWNDPDRSLENRVGMIRHLAKLYGVILPDSFKNFSETFQGYLDGIARAMGEFGKFDVSTFTGAMERLRYEFELFDIEDPIEQLRRILKIFDEFTGIDLSNLSPEDLGRAAELLFGFGEADLAGRASIAEELAALLDIPLGQMIEILTKLLEDGKITSEEWLEFLAEIENLADQAGGGTGTSGGQSFGVSRNVTITEAQGRQWISLGNTQLLVMRAQERHLADMLALVQRLVDDIDGVTPAGGSRPDKPGGRGMLNQTVFEPGSIVVHVPAGSPAHTRQAAHEGARTGVEAAFRARYGGKV